MRTPEARQQKLFERNSEKDINRGHTEQANLAISKTFLKERRRVGMGQSVGGHKLASLSPSADV